jgi:hypothetical protein
MIQVVGEVVASIALPKTYPDIVRGGLVDWAWRVC